MTDRVERKKRVTLESHPAAALFPMLGDEEFQALVEDIKRHGLIHPIVMHDGMIVDGRCRSLACIAAGVAPQYRDYEGDCSAQGVMDYVISVNAHRRNLTAEQKRTAIKNILKLNPAKSNRMVAETFKVDHKTVAAVRAEGERTGEIPQLTETVGKDGKARPSTKKKPPAIGGDFETTKPKKAAHLSVLTKPDNKPTGRGPIAADEKVMVLEGFARFVIERYAKFTFSPEDTAEWKVLRKQVEAVLGAAP